METTNYWPHWLSPRQWRTLMILGEILDVWHYDFGRGDIADFGGVEDGRWCWSATEDEWNQVMRAE